jgi:hypothetical protein
MKRLVEITAAVLIAACTACGSSAGATSSVKAPTDLKVEPLQGGAHLTWKDNSDNEAGFMIERMMGTSAWSTVGTVPFDTTQYHDGNLTGTMYMYRVMAMPKSGGNGAYSGEVMFTATASSSSAGSGGIGSAGASGMVDHSGHMPAAAGAH